MRATSLLRTLIALQDTIVVGFEFDLEGIIIDIRPTWRVGRCSECGGKAPKYDDRERLWRHLDLGGIRCELRYAIRRVSCSRCGVKVESVPWAESGSRFTEPFEMHTAYLAQHNDKTTVTKLMRIAWDTVGKIIQRFVRRQRGDVDRLDGLRVIGVDELSYRRHHEYVTVVVDHERGDVVWAAPGKSAETLKRFFDALGPERCGKLEAVTIDMSAAYIKAVSEASPQAKIIFDRFHVQRLAQEAVDEVRREEVREAEPEDKKALKKTRWALLKNPWNLTELESEKLVELQGRNQRIYRAYLLKEALAGVLDCTFIEIAEVKLDEWLAWASRSQLQPFVKLARTVRSHRDGILEYVRDRLNNGRVEGINGKARTITRRSYGFHSAASLIAMLFLCCGGIHACPAHIYPFWTH
jgi:transposase